VQEKEKKGAVLKLQESSSRQKKQKNLFVVGVKEAKESKGCTPLITEFRLSSLSKF